MRTRDCRARERERERAKKAKRKQRFRDHGRSQRLVVLELGIIQEWDGQAAATEDWKQM